MKKIFFQLIFAGIISISCNQTKKELRKESEQSATKEITPHEIDSLNKKASVDLSLSYNAISNFVKMTDYTFQLQEIFDTGNKVISFTGYINDIIKIDSNYILKVRSNGYSDSKKDWFAEILLSSTKFQELYRILFSESFERNGCFVIKNTRLKSIRTLSINSEIDGYESTSEDDENSVNRDALYSNVTYGFEGKLFIFKGELVDFYLFKTKEWYKTINQ